MRMRIISIGTLAFNHLWGETQPVRTGHATTTLIEVEDAKILVDPGLPDRALVAHLGERANLKPGDVTHVFLTSFQPDTCRGLRAFDHATWWVSEREREAVGGELIGRVREAHEHDDQELIELLTPDIAVLERCKPAPDALATGVDLFPLPGVTPGLTGLLLAEPNTTTLVCGDAITTVEHLERGSVAKQCFDIEQAQESFREAIEIADQLVLGRDNLVVNPTRWPF
jgi:glyoxylase-like metal-dependent hydrolase (beta-lactamase superfamily II)